MTKPYEPELGQALFGQPTQTQPASESTHRVVEAARCIWSVLTTEPDTPFSNSGYGLFSGDRVEVESYSWNEDYAQPWNLKWRDWEVSWYKYAGRGMTQNRDLTVSERRQFLRDCIEDFRE